MNYSFIILLSSLTAIALCFEETYTDNSKNYCNRKGIYDRNTKFCTCLPDYITYPIENYQQINQCNYAQKSKVVLRIISFLWGYLGADQIYLGNTIKGMLKVLIPIIAFFILFYFKNYSKTNDIPDYYYLIPFTLSIFFWLIDMLYFALFSPRDHYGIELV